MTILAFIAGLAAGYFGKALIDKVIAKFSGTTTEPPTAS